MKEKLVELTKKRHALLVKLVEPARAAANQMKDAGMSRGADPLLEILFQVNAIDQEVQDLFAQDPMAAIDVISRLMGGA